MKPGIPQGTRDFNAETIRKRQYIFNTIRSVFELYGFEPLETPAFENLETLMGKYGEEGDKLIFKILNNGLYNPAKEKNAREDFEKVLAGKSVAGLTERALRYDLTIPFARYVAMNFAQLTFPFKRYQMQPVWRADRPQKGRYREFYQCDADVVGSHSLLNEVEFAAIYAEVFKRLKVDTDIKINSRKMLAALAVLCGGIHNLVPITVAIDKLDKIGAEKVKDELAAKNFDDEQVTIIEKYLGISGNNEEKLAGAVSLFGNNAEAKKGIEELTYLCANAGSQNVQIDFTLARGLNYYTGIIYEVKATNVRIGSIGGGGRYDDLTGLFGVPNVPGIGISFGVDRIYDVMEELKCFPADIYTGTSALFFNMGIEESGHAFNQMQALRSQGISAEMYHEPAKLDKQFKYANRKKIAFAILIGSQEILDQNCIVKNLNAGTQQTIPVSQLAAVISGNKIL